MSSNYLTGFNPVGLIKCRHRELEYYNYRCPFSIIDQFDKWFEWYKRKHFDGQETGEIICSMIESENEIAKHKVEDTIRFKYRMYPMPIIQESRVLINHIT